MNSNCSPEGFFEIGINHPAHAENIGTLWRSAYQLGAAGIFSIGREKHSSQGDTAQAWHHIPYRRYQTFTEFKSSLPYSTILVAVEIGGVPLASFKHPDRCIYLLGSEHNGLSTAILGECHVIVSLESVRSASYNVAVTGSILMYHRLLQRQTSAIRP